MLLPGPRAPELWFFKTLHHHCPLPDLTLQTLAPWLGINPTMESPGSPVCTLGGSMDSRSDEPIPIRISFTHSSLLYQSISLYPSIPMDEITQLCLHQQWNWEISKGTHQKTKESAFWNPSVLGKNENVIKIFNFTPLSCNIPKLNTSLENKLC